MKRTIYVIEACYAWGSSESDRFTSKAEAKETLRLYRGLNLGFRHRLKRRKVNV